jgi:NAD(P)-dependent dehydrogenase (short-subunit alcohol dehydrogenase family)
LKMSRQPHILVTGSTGNLGEKAVSALAGPGCRITRVGRNSNQRPDVVAADLTTFDAAWAKHFEGVDTVLHLAADPKPVSTWESVQRLNIDLSLNVLRAAQVAGVKRFVFASSNWILGGYRFSDTPLRPETPPRPVNPYGASKLFSDRVGLALSNQCGMTFLSLRIGYCAPGDNAPGTQMAFGRWGQEMWLSNEDWAQAVQKACLGPAQESAVLNIMSNNSGMRWDLSRSKVAIGFDPVSKHDPYLNVPSRIREQAARLRDRVFPQMSEAPAFGRRW